MSNYNIDVYDPYMNYYNTSFAHIILWMPLLIILFILESENKRFECKCLKKHLITFKKYVLKFYDGSVIDTGIYVPGSNTITPIKTECKCDAKNSGAYLKFLLFLIIPAIGIQFYGYYMDNDFYLLHLFTWVLGTIIFILLAAFRY